MKPTQLIVRLDTHLEHGAHVVHVLGAREVRFRVTQRLHEHLGRLRHVVHLDGVELLPLPLARHRHACSHKHVRDVRAPEQPQRRCIALNVMCYMTVYEE